jgi:hypothetical protein
VVAIGRDHPLINAREDVVGEPPDIAQRSPDGEMAALQPEHRKAGEEKEGGCSRPNYDPDTDGIPQRRQFFVRR